MNRLLAALPFGALLLLAAGVACQPEINLPEFSDQLQSRSIPAPSLKKDETLIDLFSTDGGAYCLTTRGTLFSIDTQALRLKPVSRFAGFERGYPQGDRLLVSRGQSRWSLYSLTENRNIQIRLPDLKEPLLFDSHHMLYLTAQNRLVCLDLRGNRIVSSMDWKERSEPLGTRLDTAGWYLVFPHRLYQFTFADRRLRVIPLKEPVESRVLFHGNHLYYGTPDRYFVKYSLTGQSRSWKRKLPHRLSHSPLPIGDLLAVVPEDNNIYFFSKAGNLEWVQTLEKSLLFPPLALADSVATILYPLKAPLVNFFTPGTRERRRYQVEVRLDDPVYHRENLLMLAEDKSGRFRRVLRVSNRKSVTLQIHPGGILQTGQAVTIRLNSINLPEPSYRIAIKTGEDAPLLDKEIAPWEKPSLTIVPARPGEYFLQITVTPKDGEPFSLRQSFWVFDVHSKLQNYFYHLQLKSRTDRINIDDCPKPEEKSD